LAKSGQIQEAHKVMAEGPAFDESTATHHFFKGNLHFVADQLDDAVVCFQNATQLSPQDPLILLNLCATQIKRSDFFSALETGQRILSLDPDSAAAYGHMAIAHQFTGQHSLTIQNYRNALRLNPEQLQTHQNLLLALTCLPSYPREEYLLEAQRYAVKASARAKPYAAWLCSNYSPGTRPLRVGFVSADLMYHPVGMFLDNVLPFLDPARISCIAYSNCAAEDAFTAHLKPMFDEWTRVAWMPDDELVRKIHGDSIDILVDLSGHTGQSRLTAFAWRPAPVQLSWLGYWASTGLTEMDYLLVDPISVHPDEANYYSEKLWFLPDTRLCFSPPATTRPIVVNDLPALRKGHITFASFQTLSKLTNETIATWSKILANMPSARLRIQSRALSYPHSVADMKDRLASAHIDPSRVDLFGVSSRDGYLTSYGDVDIVLDTFPFPGGTTTAEALWMGIPTVTFTGNTLVSRQGESMLRCAGLEDWVARTEQEYVQIAVERASDVQHLAQLRAGLRAAVLASPLFDGARFAKNLVTAFEGMAARTVAGSVESLRASASNLHR
jgi:predicted O-linked N-acetylglucosamine transferase (SPINDLY family)